MAMEHLKSIGTLVYLKLPLDTLAGRVGNLKGRGVVLEEGKTLEDLYRERIPLYEKYADIIIEERDKDLEECLQMLLEELDSAGSRPDVIS